MVHKMKTLQAQKKDMSRKQIITFALVVTYAIASRAMNSSLMANYECAFVEVFLEDISLTISYFILQTLILTNFGHVVRM